MYLSCVQMSGKLGRKSGCTCQHRSISPDKRAGQAGGRFGLFPCSILALNFMVVSTPSIRNLEGFSVTTVKQRIPKLWTSVFMGWNLSGMSSSGSSWYTSGAIYNRLPIGLVWCKNEELWFLTFASPKSQILAIQTGFDSGHDVEFYFFPNFFVEKWRNLAREKKHCLEHLLCSVTTRLWRVALYRNLWVWKIGAQNGNDFFLIFVGLKIGAQNGNDFFLICVKNKLKKWKLGAKSLLPSSKRPGPGGYEK